MVCRLHIHRVIPGLHFSVFAESHAWCCRLLQLLDPCGPPIPLRRPISVTTKIAFKLSTFVRDVKDLLPQAGMLEMDLVQGMLKPAMGRISATAAIGHGYFDGMRRKRFVPRSPIVLHFDEADDAEDNYSMQQIRRLFCAEINSFRERIATEERLDTNLEPIKTDVPARNQVVQRAPRTKDSISALNSKYCLQLRQEVLYRPLSCDVYHSS